MKKKRKIFEISAFFAVRNTDLFCSFRQSTNALGAQCLFHRFAVFINGHTLKIRMECPVRRAL